MDSVRLRELRDGRKITMEKLAETIEKSVVSYGKKERGEIPFMPEEVIALSKFYDLSYDEINAIFFNGRLPNGNFETLERYIEALNQLQVQCNR